MLDTMGVLNSRSELKVQEVYKGFKDGAIIVDQSYQRRNVWLDRDKIRLIETILLKLIVPEIYFWDAETDPDSGETITHIVDGQQRINAIVEFIDGKYRLQNEMLIEESSKQLYGNKTFNELDNETKILIWSFPLSIIRINNGNDNEEVRKIFYRVNLTNYSLNDQEKRHSNNWGKFADLTQRISDLDVWDKYSLFNSGDIRRMKDQEFFSSLILLQQKGIIDQTTQKPLNDAYEDYATGYPEMEEDFVKIKYWLSVFEELYQPNISSFIKKRTQLYTIFCLIRYMCINKIAVSEEIKQRLYDFINKYNQFENTTNNEIFNEGYDSVRQYKLASSEGVNKMKNRKIRFEILKNYVIDGVVE